MRKILTIISFGVILLSSPKIFAQNDEKVIVIDVSQSINDQQIMSNIQSSDLPNLKLRLKNLDNSVSASNYSISGVNFEDMNSLSLTNSDLKIDVNKQLTFKLGALENFEINENDTNYVLKITYSGDDKPVVFGDNQSIELPINITQTENITIEDSCKTFTPLQIQDQAVEYVENDTDYEEYYSNKTNLFLKDNTVHIYIDENGNLINTSIPTTAKESYLYQVHLLYEENNCENALYKFSYDGKYRPEFRIMKTGEDVTTLNSTGEEEKEKSPKIKEIDFAIIGPFTDEFEIKLVKEIDGQNTELINQKIDVAKLYHVSISTGLLYTSLRNPQNIETATMANGETTLIADDPRDRGILTIMATYYPWGRSFLFPPTGGPFDPTRLGIQVGTKLDKDIEENFFFGLSHDFARGGTFSYGVHYGRRNFVAGAADFDFGKDVFDLPELNVKKEWDVGFYVGVVIDTRVAVELIKSLGGK
jgi:hypothetical protein